MKHLRISHKIIVLLAVLLVVNSTLAVLLLMGMSDVNQKSTDIADNWLPSVRLMGEVNADVALSRIARLKHLEATDPAQMDKFEAEIKDDNDKVMTALAAYEKLLSSDEERAIYDRIITSYKKYADYSTQYLKLSRDNRKEEAKALSAANMAQIMGEFNQAVQEGIKINNVGSEKASDDADKIYATQRLIGMVGLLLATAIAGGIVFLLNRAVAKPIVVLKNYMAVLQGGDYSKDVPLADQRDEVGQMAGAIQSFRESLIANRAMEARQREEDQKKLERQARVDALVKAFDMQASGMVNNVASAATELAQTATSLNQQVDDAGRQATGVAGAADQTSGTVQSVASAAEEMSASIREISQQVAHSSTMVHEASRETQSADATSKEMLEAARSINSIAEIIDGIASQINLLALNATIESARAGEAGKGFAVVASEVKTLASQTGRATEEIRQKLDGLQHMAGNVAEALQKVGRSVERVNEVSGNISAAVEEQTAVTHEIVSNMNTAAAGVEEINSNIQGIRETNNHTSAATQQILSASKVLSQQAEDLNAQVRRFLDEIRAA